MEVSEFNINKKGKVNSQSLNLHESTIEKLEDNLLLYFTGFSRNSSKILSEQNKKL